VIGQVLNAPIRGLLFDKDGTLLDYHASWMPLNIEIARLAAQGNESLARELLTRCGYDEAKGRVRSGTPLAVGTNDEIARSLSAILGDRMPDDLETAIGRIFASGAPSVPVPRLHQSLTALRTRVSYLGMATHDTLAGIEASLGPHDVLPMFDFLAASDSGHGHKPGPGMAEAFCAAAGLRPSEICVVGDNPHDLEMGRSAGAGFIVGVLTGTSETHDLEELADAIYPGLAELAADQEFLARLR
jgi:phosphoglycolate phosphatase